MTLLNKHRSCASEQKYNEYKALNANNIKQLQSSGTILGLKARNLYSNAYGQFRTVC